MTKFGLRATALVSPTEHEYELITSKVKDLMEEGRGETIFEVGQDPYVLN